MTIVCIAGVTRGIGKTAVAEMLLRELRGWHAARVRVADEISETSPIGDEGYMLLAQADLLADDEEVQRLLAAGAAGASVLLAEPRGLEAGLDTLIADLPKGANLLVEGNAFLWARPADLAVMVVAAGPSGKGLARVRPSVREVFDKVDLWVWNSRSDPMSEGFFEFPQALTRMGFRGAVTNRADFHHVNPGRANDAGNRRFLAALCERLRQTEGRKGP